MLNRQMETSKVATLDSFEFLSYFVKVAHTNKGARSMLTYSQLATISSGIVGRDRNRFDELAI